MDYIYIYIHIIYIYIYIHTHTHITALHIYNRKNLCPSHEVLPLSGEVMRALTRSGRHAEHLSEELVVVLRLPHHLHPVFHTQNLVA